jgi:hypothetical protein
MKCINHNATDAVGSCMYCGRALCPACAPSAASRLVCSETCQTGLERTDRAVQSLLEKSVQSAKASALYCYLCGGLSAAAAVAGWFIMPSPFLIFFTAGCALVLFAAGAWYGRGGKSSLVSKAAV